MTDFSHEAFMIQHAVQMACQDISIAAGTLRDRFAIAALTSIIGDYTGPHAINNVLADGIAQDCYLMADAMMKAREAIK